MRKFINIVLENQEIRSVNDLDDYEGDSLKPDCTKKIPEEIQFADFSFVFWMGGDIEEMKSKYECFIEALDKATDEVIDHKDMVTGQICVNPEKVEYLMNNPTDNLPIIYRWNMNNIIQDGNHRITADVLNGKTNTKCQVLHLDEYFDEKGNLID